MAKYNNHLRKASRVAMFILTLQTYERLWSILENEGATAADAVPGLRAALSDSSAPKNGAGMTVCWKCGTF